MSSLISMNGDRKGDQGSSAARVQSVIKTLQTHADPFSRRDAAIALGGIPDDSAIEALSQALHDPVKDVRAAAAAGLDSVSQPAIGALNADLADRNWVVRYRAAKALGSIKDERSVSALIRTLEDRRDHVRYMAARGLGKLGERRAAGPLSAACADENEFVRRAAREALAALG